MSTHATTLTRIGPLSLARISGVLYAGFGLLFSAIMALVTLAAIIGGAERFGAGMSTALGGVLFIVLAPVIYGSLGFVIGLISALLYNFLAKIFGGIELDFDCAAQV